MKLLNLTLSILLLSSILFGQIKYVPTDYRTIQNAVAEADSGDVIIVEEGRYSEQINFLGKAITVASEFYLDGDTSHISNTIIDGSFFDSDSSSIVYFINGEDSTSVLMGFTLQNGKGTKILNPLNPSHSILIGGAIFLDSSGAKIENNIIKNNCIVIDDYLNTSIKAFGGGIASNYVLNSQNLIIKNNIIKNNKAQGRVVLGGAIDIFSVEGKVVISGNRIIGNTVKAKDSGYGGGIDICEDPSEVIIENNFIANNKTYSSIGASRGGGIACYFSAPTIRNNIIVFNETQFPSNSYPHYFGGGIAAFWNIEDNWNWKIDPYNLVVKIENNTIAYNNDPLKGGGLGFIDVGARLKNNIIGCNFSDNDSQIKVEFLSTEETKARTVKVEYCNIEGGYEGVENINKFPEFMDEERWYLKKDISPCVDAGDPQNIYEDIQDPTKTGSAYFPALGTTRNDMGAFGGPHSKWADILGPVSNIEESVVLLPEHAELYQNYPNPFNPSTIINYDIPDESHVSLKVIDLLGREVAILVNGEQKTGNYEVEFDASNLASGVYFCKLTLNDFVETKKMLLLK